MQSACAAHGTHQTAMCNTWYTSEHHVLHMAHIRLPCVAHGTHQNTMCCT